MGPVTFWDSIREWLAGIAFEVFLRLSKMTNDEYLDMIYDEARREVESARANDWMMQ